jgi:hypothetical protein
VTTIRTVAAHEVVRRLFPRPPPTEKEAVAIAVGRAIDAALSRYGHELRLGRRPTLTSLGAHAEELLDDGLAEGAVAIGPQERATLTRQMQETLRAYRGSVIAGLPRPKSRLIVIDRRAGVYAQPDYWDGRGRFFEMKSYRAIPPPPDIALQLRLFQLAFPGFEAVLVCFDRHASPVAVSTTSLPSPSPNEAASTLREAYATALELGQDRVLEYVDSPRIDYPLPPAPA